MTDTTDYDRGVQDGIGMTATTFAEEIRAGHELDAILRLADNIAARVDELNDIRGTDVVTT